jgi:hypothetical protein
MMRTGTRCNAKFLIFVQGKNVTFVVLYSSSPLWIAGMLLLTRKLLSPKQSYKKSRHNSCLKEGYLKHTLQKLAWTHSQLR